MLWIMGLFLFGVGGWFCGAVYATAPAWNANTRAINQRVVGGYMIGVVFIGIGSVLMFGI